MFPIPPIPGIWPIPPIPGIWPILPIPGMVPIPGMPPIDVRPLKISLGAAGPLRRSSVIEHDDPFGVVTAGIGRVVDDDRHIQAVVGVQPGVRMRPVGARRAT